MDAEPPSPLHERWVSRGHSSAVCSALSRPWVGSCWVTFVRGEGRGQKLQAETAGRPLGLAALPPSGSASAWAFPSTLCPSPLSVHCAVPRVQYLHK